MRSPTWAMRARVYSGWRIIAAGRRAALLADHGALVHAARRGPLQEREVHGADLGPRVVEPLDPLDGALAPAHELVALAGVVLHQPADPAGGELHVRELVRLQVVGQ